MRVVEHTSFVVSDLDRSVAFYGLLGWEVEWRIDADATTPLRGQVGYPTAVASIAQLHHGDEVHRLELIQYLEPRGRAQPPQRCDVGAAHMCLRVDDIDAEADRLQRAGVRFVSPPQRFADGPDAGAVAVYLLDPDGITVELTQPATAESGRE